MIAAVMLMAALAAFLMMAGCRGESGGDAAKNPPGELKVGLIDSDRLLENYPEYKKFVDKKEKETLQVRNMLSTGKKLSEKDKEYVKSTTLNYMKSEEVILKNFVERVREASSLVMAEKKLSLVINNPGTASVIEFGGQDITSEVQAKLSQKQSEGTTEKK
jgi:hypothetical protein